MKAVGFAAMSPERRKEISRRAGIKVHQLGVGHTFTSEEARKAGRKGGASVSKNREHMAAIGRKGGLVISKDREHMAAIGVKGGEIAAILYLSRRRANAKP